LWCYHSSHREAVIDSNHPPTTARFLEQTLLFNLFIHAVAMASMALILLPGIPGGSNASAVARAIYVANHPWLWRLGWFPWQLTALADLLLGVALLKTAWIPRGPAIVTMIWTVAAILPDQGGQLFWVTRGVYLAQHSLAQGNFEPYLRFESMVFPIIAAWAALGYTAGALGWTWCFAAAGTWSRWLTWLSVATWSVFGLSTAIVLVPAAWRPPAAVAGAGNAIGFGLLEVWLILVIEQVLRRSRPDQSHGSHKPWRHPSRGAIGECISLLANSRFARLLAEHLPPPALQSDIRDVLYINYLVEADRLISVTPIGLELQRLGPDRRYALFSILTYRHGHFGPRVLGPLRRLAPSPIQSNWRIYVTHPQSQSAGVYFVENAISSTPYALTARLISEGMPMHVLHQADINRAADCHLAVTLEPGSGSAPDLRADLTPTHRASLSGAWLDCFESFQAFLAYCVPQDRALAPQPWYGRVISHEIQLGIPLESCEPMTGNIDSAAARQIAGDSSPVCFRVPAVKFSFSRQVAL
jgi:hypothetical protein